MKYFCGCGPSIHQQPSVKDWYSAPGKFVCFASNQLSNASFFFFFFKMHNQFCQKLDAQDMMAAPGMCGQPSLGLIGETDEWRDS